MSRIQEPDDTPPTVVFRPRRRCPRCGLVNADLAPRCRRCRRRFDDIDPAAESVRMVERMRVRRAVAIIAAVVILGGLFVTGYGYWRKQASLSEFDERSHRIGLDLETTERGSDDDARLIASAFDEGEVLRVLADQAGAWKERSRVCAEIRADVDSLVPQNPAQTEIELQIERRLDALTRASNALLAAAGSNDAKSGREAAQRFLNDANLGPSE